MEEPNFSDHDHIILLIIHSVFAIASALLTAVIAREQSRRATGILGTKEIIFWMIGSILLWNHSPFWVNIAKAILGPPLSWIGGWIYERIIHKTQPEALKKVG